MGSKNRSAPSLILGGLVMRAILDDKVRTVKTVVSRDVASGCAFVGAPDFAEILWRLTK
jgi:hypothetical protein